MFLHLELNYLEGKTSIEKKFWIFGNFRSLLVSPFLVRRVGTVPSFLGNAPVVLCTRFPTVYEHPLPLAAIIHT